ncbi:hypothetical protein Kpol_1008p2 [Vanderwaltozyma polyspora DSM 70294]|uniref:TLC domain-containing protein n=1 Tax=Vanderwaltozyma polyspora (strain ATCC 22028 / DSM 70294 / BCRC 21397 / CBS 2163 / NBRC 10782 / NRRL Y-8283 / UCD 57-17) TaxID=436907 RepID=A7TPW8_VANPO|nr:uncharacterized protein Kpol_1008p2 [Vanderwaltozyma polyspora DSM 70294]EDO15666.1 hypothetical protein Kpol_1008p2 [Vanderwaltozyma polyspora DSM 70294]
MEVDPFLQYSWYPESDNLFLLHLHEIFFSYLFYQILSSFIVPIANKQIFGHHYTSITSEKLKIDFDIHSVSMVQCTISLFLLAPVLTLPLGLNIVTYHDPYCSLVSAITIGYFVWDIIVCIRYYNLYGLQFLIHGIISFYVFCITLIPFSQPWIGKFLLFEASTPFVNINWYIIQLTKTAKDGKAVVPTWFNVLNGILLMVVFFLVRIVWGFTAITLLVFEMWKIRDELPVLLSISCVLLNLVMDFLNVFWFSKMIKIAKKLASSPKQDHKE